ncbi:hypothetical protein EMPS_02243 [Entomortierella parvispora]|uniref:Chromo domain-containing protein n=1 Tax=Entomortierella parvispora TaxID=205924 RepID=A0A9P3LTF8_9FUNG|nr:hypothetical protein EMPS_02243 [Entomortierella parvispora]
MSESVSQDLCLVDRILDKRIDVDTGEVEYLIRWLGADRDGNDFEDSWEPDYNVFGEELVEEFERMRTARRLQYKANKAGRLSVHSSPRVDGDDHGVQRLHSVPPRYHAQVPSSTPGSSKTTMHDHQQVPSLPTAGQPPHYPVLSRPPRSLAPLPSYPPTSLSLYSKPALGRLPSSKVPTRDATKALESTIGESATVDTAEPMNVDETDESPSQNDKRKRDGTFQLAKRSVMTNNGPIIRPLNLDFDLERSYFKSVIVKSPLVKDATIRKEMLMILKNPEQPGLADNATLKRSETWLIEVKRQQQQDLDVSLFLALDIPKGIAKALFLPQSILERQRQDNPGSGLVLTDRTIVSSILMGDLEGSGLCPPATPVLEEKTIIPDDTTTPKPSSPSETPLVSTPSNDTTELEEKPEVILNGHSGDTNMESPTPESNGSVESYSCGWEGCGRTLGTAEELQSHVMDSHLKSLLNGVSLANPKNTKSIKTEEVNGSHSTADLDLTSEQTWEIRYELAQDAYRSMKDEISQLKGLVQKTDDLIESSKLLYTTAIGSSEETIRRLEASLEWEKKKWSKYVDEVKSKGAKVEGAQPQPSGVEQVPEALVLDQPMEAQAMNAIRRIERLLEEAKKEQEQLEKDNAALYAKKKGLEEELRKVTLHYEEAAAELSELESKELSTLEELKARKLNIQRYRKSMEQEQEESRKTIKNLQDTIDTLMKAPVNSAIVQKEDLLIPPPDTVDGPVFATAPDTAPAAPTEDNEDVSMTLAPGPLEAPSTTIDTQTAIAQSIFISDDEEPKSMNPDSVDLTVPVPNSSVSTQPPAIEQPEPAIPPSAPAPSDSVFAAEELAVPEMSAPLPSIPTGPIPTTTAAIPTTASLLSHTAPNANGFSSPIITLTDSTSTPSTGFSPLPVTVKAPIPTPSYVHPPERLRPPEPKVEWHALEDPEEDEDHSNPATMNLVLPSTPDLLQLTNEDYGDIMDDESVERSSPSSASASNLTIDSASAPLGGLHPSSGMEDGVDPLAGLLGDPTDFIDLLTKSLNP